jgi:hypothetical protein
MGTFECGQFAAEGFKVKVDEVILARGDGKVAIPAVVGAERDVDVGGPWPLPGGPVLPFLQDDLR